MKENNNRFFRVIGYRGLPSKYPENTLASFKAAAELGVDAIEFEVHRTKDGIPVIIHDDDVARCSGGHGRLVREMTFEELRALDFGAWKHDMFRGTKIPTLGEAFDTIVKYAPDELEILIELHENDFLCTETVGDELAKRDLAGRCRVLSSFANQLALLRKKHPEIRLQGFRRKDFAVDIPESYDILSRVSIRRSDLSEKEINFFHNRNIEVNAFPADTPSQLDEILKFDVDTVTTNAADILMRLLRERGLRPPAMPEKFRAWQLHGAGLEQLGTNGKPDMLPLPQLHDGELLVKIEALGLCFSDIKIIRAGEKHPKILISDLKKTPLIPGHEAVMTVVKRGKDVPLRFAPGRRFLIQCDIFVRGQSRAYGYCMDGGLSEYSILDSRVWKGEEFSYLIDAPVHLSRAATALIEPWTCVNAAYRIKHRDTPAHGGKILIVCGKNPPEHIESGELLKQAEFSRIESFGLPEKQAQDLSKQLGRPVEKLNHLPEKEEFDDVFFIGSPDIAAAEAIALGARSSVFSFLGNFPEQKWKIDVGALHYKRYYYQGASGNNLSEPYMTKRREGLLPGGKCWMLGGAGAMGQMHTQLAAENPNGPKKILVTDLDKIRIGHVRKQLFGLAAERGAELAFANPGDMTPQVFEQMLQSFAPEGFDDIVILVPSAKAAEQAAGHLGKNGLMNIFAGIPAGERMSIFANDVSSQGKRFTGSSGSSLEDMLFTLDKASKGLLRTERAMAAVAGMNAAREGLFAVSEGLFPGKIVVYPECPDLPLVSLSNLWKVCPEAAEKLDSDGCLTPEAEEAILNKFSLPT